MVHLKPIIFSPMSSIIPSAHSRQHKNNTINKSFLYKDELYIRMEKLSGISKVMNKLRAHQYLMKISIILVQISMFYQPVFTPDNKIIENRTKNTLML